MKISRKWKRISELYRRFAVDYPAADFSDNAALSMYQHETLGYPLPKDDLNGFALGKKWMDVTIAAWKEDIEIELLFISELQLDGYPDWFLKRIGILKGV